MSYGPFFGANEIPASQLDKPATSAVAQTSAANAANTRSATTTNVTCRWCGKPVTNLQAWLCGECDKPRRLRGYAVAIASFAATTLLLPLILIGVTYWLNSEQQRIANRQKLADAYVAFGTAMTDYRRAAATFDLLTKGSSKGTVSLSEVKKALLDLDAAFNAIGAKLGPFEEAARRSPENGIVATSWNWIWTDKTAIKSKAADEISLTWNNCFVAPYYGTSAVPTDKTYWYKMHNTLRLCTADRCPRSVTERVANVLSDIFTGTCVCGQPEQHRPLVWLYPAIQSLMQEREVSEISKPPGETLVAKPNLDLLATNNAFCKSQPQTRSP